MPSSNERSFKDLIKTMARMGRGKVPSHLMVGFLKAQAGPSDHEEAIQVDGADGEAGNLVPVHFACLAYQKSLTLDDILAFQPPLLVDWSLIYVIGALPKGEPDIETVEEIILQQLDRAADLNFDPEAGISLFDRTGAQVTDIVFPAAASSTVH